MSETTSVKTWIAIVTLCLLFASSAWALSSTISNGRGQAVTERVTELEDEADDRDIILERIITKLDAFALTLGEVRADVKVLLTLP